MAMKTMTMPPSEYKSATGQIYCLFSGERKSYYEIHNLKFEPKIIIIYYSSYGIVQVKNPKENFEVNYNYGNIMEIQHQENTYYHWGMDEFYEDGFKFNTRRDRDASESTVLVTWLAIG